MGMILAISDVILISAVKMLINAFGISKYKDKKHIALSIAVSADCLLPSLFSMRRIWILPRLYFIR